MKWIIRENVPVWYEISVGLDGLSLIFKIHKLAMNYIYNTLNGNYKNCFDGIQQANQLPEFIVPNGQNNWGFGSVLSFVANLDFDWVTVKCNLPQVLFFKNKDLVNNNWKAANSISATINLLVEILNTFPINNQTNEKNVQLLTLTLLTDPGVHGFSINVDLSVNVCKWIKSKTKSNQESVKCAEILTTLQTNFFHLNGKSSSKNDFTANLDHPQWIWLGVPGGSCQLHSEKYEINSGQGYRLIPHNIESSIQQLSFLMGLAKMHDLIRNTGL